MREPSRSIAQRRTRHHRSRPAKWASPAEVELDLRQAMPGKRIEWLGPARRARFTMQRVGPAQVLRATVPPMVISSSDPPCDHVGRAPGAGQKCKPQPDAHRENALHLAVHLEGPTQYSQEGAEDEVHLPGTVVLIDFTRPCAAVHTEGASVLVWSLPRALIMPYLPELPPVASLTGAPGRVVATQARMLAQTADRLPLSLRRALVDHLASLIGLTFACCRAEALHARASHASCRRARVRAYLEAHFRDPHLTVEGAARDLGMSRRWLQAQFESGKGFASALARRRLEAGLALLHDPAAAHLTVTDVAFAVGFNDLSTFHRRFRRRYGVSPGAARSRHREG